MRQAIHRTGLSLYVDPERDLFLRQALDRLDRAFSPGRHVSPHHWFVLLLHETVGSILARLAAACRVTRGQSFPAPQDAPPFVLGLAALFAAIAVDKLRQAITRIRQRTANETR